ncbi:MAG TPA: MBL fold metallo-hydrolase [Candidatus Paceibacterota bacterium]
MRKVGYGAILLLAFANVAVWPYVLKAQTMQVTFFDVGQGDAIFIETKQGHQILIDGGPNNAVVEKLGQALPFADKSLDLVVLTHPDADHITGLVGVLEAYDVENVLWTGVEKKTNIFASWQEALRQEEANIWLVNDPQVIRWSQSSKERLEVLYAADQAKEVNDTSVVTKLVFGETSFLFPGDISKIAEQEMLQQDINIDADILKIPHHGSKYSSTENFLAAVSPGIAVIQVGKNSYGHPTPEVLERLGHIPILRNDQIGDIIIQSNGNELTAQ